MIAILLLPETLTLFFGLFRSVLEALFLPFRLLLDLAGWHSTGFAIDNASTSIGRAARQADTSYGVWHRYLPSILIVLGILPSMTDRQTLSTAQIGMTISFYSFAAFCIGTPLAGLLLLPLAIQLFCLTRKTETPERS